MLRRHAASVSPAACNGRVRGGIDGSRALSDDGPRHHATHGLVLAAVGISGVTYRGVIDRTKEFAVRLVLGSRPGGIVRLVLWESAGDLALGAAAGLAGGVALCVVLRRLMENIGTVNALTTGVAIGLIAVVGIAAACLPALRVLRPQPADALRS